MCFVPSMVGWVKVLSANAKVPRAARDPDDPEPIELEPGLGIYLEILRARVIAGSRASTSLPLYLHYSHWCWGFCKDSITSHHATATNTTDLHPMPPSSFLLKP